MTAPKLAIRPMTAGEVPLALDWAAAEGWNPGLSDAVPFDAADPGGFLIGLIDDRPAAVISAIRYGAGFGFIGFYIVRPDLRGHGHGWAIWQQAMARLQGRLIGLDGVIAQQDSYRRSGFILAHRNIRHEGPGVLDTSGDAGLMPLADMPFDVVERYDRSHFAAPRPGFLASWGAQPGSVALGAVADGRLQGYGVLRPCRTGFKVGPLFADTGAIADRLFTALRGRVPADAAVFLDTPACNPDAMALAARHGLTPMFETARMYTGAAPDIGIDRTYGITSFELG